MSKVLKLKGGTSVKHSTFIGADREVTVDTDKKTLIIHDGVTQGGHELAKKEDLNAKQDNLDKKNIDKTNQENLKTNQEAFENVKDIFTKGHVEKKQG